MSLLAAAATALTISVRVYDLYGLPPEQRAEALALAADTLARAGVEANWIDCSRVDGQPPGPPCLSQLRRGEMVLRIQHRSPRGAHVMGTAIVDDDGPNVLASVYAATIVDRSAKSGVPVATILGRVTAHEIGHLLLGSNSHSAHGLMRASWDVKWRHPSEWRFSPDDAAAIRSRMRPGYEGEVAAFVSAAGGGR